MKSKVGTFDSNVGDWLWLLEGLDRKGVGNRWVSLAQVNFVG